jgi:PhzF family phenazine biosynthesis protein
MSGPDETEILRYAAFTTAPTGGNPAGVVLCAEGLDEETMLEIAADVGFSETAFLFALPPEAVRDDGAHHHTVRYFSPRAEVPFCGHATIATGIALAHREGPGTVVLHTRSGPVAVRTRWEDGVLLATLTSVPPTVSPVDDADVDTALTALRWRREELDPSLPPRVAYAGARHLVLAAATRQRLAALDYDMEALGALMADRDWTTVQLVHRLGAVEFAVRDPFPPGGVYEDPATGAAAAALGGYLAELGAIVPPVRLTLHQGEEMGRPSTLLVDVPADPGAGVDVSGPAVPMD